MIWMWIGFVAFVLLMLALDLGVFHRKAHVVSVKEAIAWSAVWLALGSAFAVFVYFAYEGQWFGLGAVADPVDGLPNDGSTATEKYLTGYVVEKSLSVDNIFVIAMIFGFFAVPPLYQHRVLFWGILGRAGLARPDDRPRGEANRRVPLGSVPLRRLPDLNGDQDAAPKDGTHRSQQERGGPVDAAVVPGDRQVPRRALHRSRRGTRIARERGPRCAHHAG